MRLSEHARATKRMHNCIHRTTTASQPAAVSARGPEMSATDSTWAAFNAQESRLVAQAQGARLDADYWKAACQQWQDKAQALEHAKASMAQQVENLKSTLRGVYMNHDAYKHKAALLDRIMLDPDTSLMVCLYSRDPVTRRSTYDPVTSLADLERLIEEEDAEPADCNVCLGTGDGQHDGQSCAACNGRGL